MTHDEATTYDEPQEIFRAQLIAVVGLALGGGFAIAVGGGLIVALIATICLYFAFAGMVELARTEPVVSPLTAASVLDVLEPAQPRD